MVRGPFVGSTAGEVWDRGKGYGGFHQAALRVGVRGIKPVETRRGAAAEKCVGGLVHLREGLGFEELAEESAGVWARGLVVVRPG